MCFGLVAKKRKVKHENLKLQIPSSVISACLAPGCTGPCNSDVTPGCFLKRAFFFFFFLMHPYWDCQESPNIVLSSSPFNVIAFPGWQNVYHTQFSTFPKLRAWQSGPEAAAWLLQEVGARESLVSLLQTASLNNSFNNSCQDPGAA